jgi:hypothetical protein
MPDVPNAAPARYLTQVQLNDIRAFRAVVLPIETEEGAPRKRTLLIGKNGTCKSTLLRAIAIGLADPGDAQAMIASPIGRLVSRTETHGQIKLTLRGYELDSAPSDVVRIIASQDEKEYLDSRLLPEPNPPFVVAYGAGRFSSGADPHSLRNYRALDAVAGLFNHPRPLADPELTLRRLGDFFETALYERTLEGVKRVLGLEPEDTIAFRRGGGVEISGPSVGPTVSLDAWADGYRVTFTWLLDFFGWALRAGAIDEDGTIRGILLIDEVDQHLHPSMQAQVLPRLSELLPEVQIIATTHSPLVALGAAPAELVALHRLPSGEVVTAPAPDFRLYSAEDMLTDDRLFATAPYSEEVNQKTERYRELVDIPAPSRRVREQRELHALARELSRPADPAEPEVAAFEEVKSILAKHGIR